MKHSFLPLLPLIFAHAACGSLAADDTKLPALETLRGEVRTQSSSIARMNLHLAMVWSREDGSIVATQDLPVAPTFPAGFSIDFRTPPPPDAIRDLASDFESLRKAEAGAPVAMSAALGTLVAYDDRNQNGTLDLASSPSTEFVDAVVGAVNDTAFFYITALTNDAGQLAKVSDNTGYRPHLGYNVARFSERVAGDGSEGKAHSFHWFDIQYFPAVVEVAPDNALDALMCGSISKDASTCNPATPSNPVQRACNRAYCVDAASNAAQ